MKLYKYQGITEKSIDALGKRNWWFSSPSSFNDPFELKLIIPDADSIIKVKNIDRIKRYFAENYLKEKVFDIDEKYNTPKEASDAVVAQINSDEQLVKMVMERYQTDLYQLGIVSFTEKNDDILMWSHYSNFHKGICFEFDIDGPDRNLFHKVIYSNDYPGMDFENFPEIEKMFTTQLITKSNQWSYEREWRCIRMSNGLFPYIGRLSGIIFGARIPEADKGKLKAVLKGEDINFFQAKLHPYEYRLIIEPDK